MKLNIYIYSICEIVLVKIPAKQTHNQMEYDFISFI